MKPEKPIPRQLTAGRSARYPASALKTAITILVSALGLAAVATAPAAEPFALRTGDRILFVGATFIERAQHTDHLETALQLAAGSGVTGLKFRNLGWSGDSVFADARSYFGPPQEGRDRLQKSIAEFQPTVIIACYGAAEAMSTQQGWTSDPAGAQRSRAGDQDSLALFSEQYGKLLDLMAAAAGTGLRETVLLSPPPLENLGAPLPDQTANNRLLGQARDAIRKLADGRGCRFVDLFGAFGGDAFDGTRVAESPLTDNGIHYGDAGYRLAAKYLIDGLGLKQPEGLLNAAESVEALRQATIRKNRLFFHRWRPANETYLFLFRKHEQGQNAKEIPQFDPLIAAGEERIDTLKAAVFEELKKR